MEREIRKLQSAETDLLEKSESQEQVESERAEVIPVTQHILDSYEQLSIHEKNRLWKIVMEKITVYRTPDGKFSMHIYPKLPI